jgi:hypothetical protein
MVTLRERIELLEEELRFRIWIRQNRFLESFSIEELEAWSMTGERPEREEPPPGTSSFDNALLGAGIGSLLFGLR